MIAVGTLDARTVHLIERHRAERVEDLSEQVTDALVSANSAYREHVDRSDLHASISANILQILAMILDPSMVDEVAVEASVSDPARATGHRRAEQGFALDVVLRSFRVGARMVWEDLNEFLALADAPTEDLREIGTRLWVAVDESSARMASAYHATERGILRSHEQHRAALWDGLLSGRAENPAYAIEAAAVLGIPTDGVHVVVAFDPAVTSSTAELESRFGAARIQSSFVRRSADVVGVVSAPPTRITEVADLLRAHGRSACGVSAPVESLNALGVGYRQACLALGSLAGRTEVAVFDDRLADALLLCAPEIADRLVEVWCAPLLELPGWEASTLLDTVTAWAETDGSTQQAAERLYCHRNTVVNRLRRVSDVLGRDLGRPVPIELVLALRAVRLRR